MAQDDMYTSKKRQKMALEKALLQLHQDPRVVRRRFVSLMDKYSLNPLRAASQQNATSLQTTITTSKQGVR